MKVWLVAGIVFASPGFVVCRRAFSWWIADARTNARAIVFSRPPRYFYMMNTAPGAIEQERFTRRVVRGLKGSNIRKAVLAIFVLALAVVYFLPRTGLAIRLVSLATWLGVCAALLCSLTFWQKARVQIGRRGLRYRDVRRGAAIAGVIGFSFLSARMASVSVPIWNSETGRHAWLAPSNTESPEISIAHLEGDSGNRVEDALLREMDSSDTKLPMKIARVDETFGSGTLPAGSNFLNHQKVVDYLNRNGMPLMVWGSIDPKTGSAQLYETGASVRGQFGGAYRPADFKFPVLPVEDLAPILQLVLYGQSINGAFVNRRAAAAALGAALERVRQIAEANKTNSSWSADIHARVDFILAVVTAMQGGLSWDKQAIKTSISEHLSAITFWKDADHALDRAMALCSLAEPLRQLAIMERQPESYKAAVHAYSDAIAIYSAAGDAMDAAIAQQSLGRTFREISLPDNGKELPQALEAYQSALTAFNQQRNPMEWAAIQSDIAQTLVDIAKHDPGTQRLLEAVRIYQQVLLVWNRDRMPDRWAKTQLALGEALAQLGKRDSANAYLKQAIAAQRSALEVLRPEVDPVEWSRAQSNLGLALSELAMRDGSLTEFEQAIAALRAGSTIEFRQRDPDSWLAAQCTLVMTLEHLGLVEWLREGFDEGNIGTLDSSSEEHLEEAVATARSVLKEVPKDNFPSGWSYLESKLGASLKQIGEREAHNDLPGTDGHLREAVQAYNAALTVMTIKNTEPLVWAETESGLGDALRELGTRESDREALGRAIACYQMAESVETADRNPTNFAITQENIGRIYETLGLLDPSEAGKANLLQAVNYYAAAVRVTNRDNDLRNWVIHQRHLAHAEAELGERELGVNYLTQAAAAYREELKYLSPESSPTEWADANKRLSRVLDLLHQRGTDR